MGAQAWHGDGRAGPGMPSMVQLSTAGAAVLAWPGNAHPAALLPSEDALHTGTLGTAIWFEKREPLPPSCSALTGFFKHSVMGAIFMFPLEIWLKDDLERMWLAAAHGG